MKKETVAHLLLAETGKIAAVDRFAVTLKGISPISRQQAFVLQLIYTASVASHVLILLHQFEQHNDTKLTTSKRKLCERNCSQSFFIR